MGSFQFPAHFECLRLGFRTKPFLLTMANHQTSDIAHPHEHDVLSGRGNFVNYHAGNEHFRALVRKYKVDYVKCPKPQKGKFSKMIVEEIKNRNPPGRFLKQDHTTKMWYDIGEKKAMDKTRQALREGAPELMKEMKGDDNGSEEEDFSVQKNVIGNGSVNDLSNPQFNNSGFQSPGMSMPNQLHISPAHHHMMPSPQLMSPTNNFMMNSHLPSPAMSQPLTANSWHGGRMGSNMGQMLPAPPIHRRSSLDHVPQNFSAQHQQMMMMNQQAALNQQLSNQQVMNNGSNAMHQYNVTQTELENAIKVNAKLEQEMQMMQNKLNAIYSSDQQIAPTPLKVGSANINHGPADNMETLSPKLEVPTGQNSRRKPPPSLVREDSLKLDKLFASPASSKKKVDPNGSSGGLSAMSLSLADMHDDGNLSAVFDSTVRINDDGLNDKPVKKDKRSEFDMSIATLGEPGNMSVNTLSMHESDGESFGNPFEDPYKLG
eukprot:scaffold3108_cov152-Cylindrotheca_fusiformis.AAC.5